MIKNPRRKRSDWYKAVRDAGREAAAEPAVSPPPGPPPSPWLGHNQGPPLDRMRTWADHCWHRARRRAWRRAPLEVVRRRVGRARKLGLSYRPYVLVILERGVNLQAVTFAFGGTLVRGGADRIDRDALGRVRPLRGVVEKLATLTECLVFVAANDTGDGRDRSAVGELDALAGNIIDDVRVRPHRMPATVALKALLGRHGLAPSAAFLVGAHDSERRCAAEARLGLFLWAADYFNDALRR